MMSADAKSYGETMEGQVAKQFDDKAIKTVE